MIKIRLPVINWTYSWTHVLLIQSTLRLKSYFIEMNQMVNNKDKDKNNNSSNSLVVGQLPQTITPAPGGIQTHYP